MSRDEGFFARHPTLVTFPISSFGFPIYLRDHTHFPDWTKVQYTCFPLLARKMGQQLHFFFQVVGNVRVQQALRGVRQIQSRQIPVVEHAIQIKISADLGCSQAVKLITHRPSAKQISLAALDLAGARTTKGEVNTTILVQPVGFIEQLRNFLHLVDNYLTYRLLGGKLGSEQFRVVKIAAKLLGFEQIYPKSVRISGSQQCGFTCLTGSPKEKGLCAGLGELQ